MAIACNWRALSGLDGSNWNDLKDPIDVNLRWYLVHYGERVEAVNAAFNAKTHLPLFEPEVLFAKTGVQNNKPFKYVVTDYLYSTPFLENIFFGYVAVATDEGKFALGRRDILVCWKGTNTKSIIEDLEDIAVYQVKSPELFPNTEVNVHHGFLNFYTNKNSFTQYTTSARDQVLAAVRRLVDKYAELKEEVSITVAGHSLGASLATLNAMDIVYNEYNKPTGSSSGFPVTAFTYATLQVGDINFLELYTYLNLNKDLHLLRITNAKDPGTNFIQELVERGNLDFQYHHVGSLLDIDTQNSPDTKPQTELTIPHNLELYLYGIAYYQGKGNDLRRSIDFDLAILNKFLDLLLDEYKVPPKWWADKTSMIQWDDGSWKVNKESIENAIEVPRK